MSGRDEGSGDEERAPRGDRTPSPDLFDLQGADPELLNSGRIPDPQPENTPLFRALARALTAIEARLRAPGALPVRALIRCFWVLVAAVGVFLLVGPVINKPMSFDDVLASAELSEVDWVALDAKVDYAVARDAEGAFAAEVSESYTANFLNGPEPSVERVIVTEFQGHDVQFALRSATIDGSPAQTRVERGATTTTIRIERPDGGSFEGEHEIALSYELHHLVVTETDAVTERAVDRWSWPLFAPTWPQATKGIEVSLTLAPEVDEALVRSPQAYVGWLLASATDWLTPDETTPQGVRYSFSNDQTLPPNADIWITAVFEPGTFAQPPTTALFWVQTYGPLIPLALMVVLLLFALAARRVVWADSAGEPWYTARSEPPDDLPPALAARLLRKARHAELIAALGGPASAPPAKRRRKRGRGSDELPGSSTLARRERWLGEVARAARRAGRLGSTPAVWGWMERWSGDRTLIERKLRWAPDSYVRDTLILAPIAIALVQWGLLRQLSHQVILSIVWWPFAFVVLSTVLALAAVLAVRRPRPLTREGALVVQQLKGVDAYARATRLLERGPVDDPLLPYAALFAPPRAAGDRVADLAVRETGDRRLVDGWRDEHFVSAPALLALALSVAILALSIVTVSTRPAPYPNEVDFVSRSGDLPGAIYTQVEGFEIEAELQRDERGRARLAVTEHHTVGFDGSGARVPQFLREWPSERLGQDLGFELGAVRIDGRDAPHRELDRPLSGSRAVVTALEAPLEGEHDVEIDYTLTSPVVDAPYGPGESQQLRWTALYSFWDDEYYTNQSNPFDGSAPVRPIRLQFTLAPGLADDVLGGGWIVNDHERDREGVPHEYGDWYRPWNDEIVHYGDSGDGPQRLPVGSAVVLPDGSSVMTIDVDALEAEAGEPLERYELGLSGDLGVRIDFRPGTFAGIDDGAYEGYRFAYGLPYVLLLALAAAVIVASVAVIVFSLRTRRRASASLITVGVIAIPAAALAQCVLFFWTVAPMPGDDPRIPAAIVLGNLMLAAAVAQGVFVLRAGGRSAARPADRAADS